jgi:NTP-dependent ternary system trypsin peptidase co-occuring protein
MRAAEEAFAAIAHPDELVIEFAIALKGSTGIPILVSAGAESTFKVTATWKGTRHVEEATSGFVDGSDRA